MTNLCFYHLSHIRASTPPHHPCLILWYSVEYANFCLEAIMDL